MSENWFPPEPSTASNDLRITNCPKHLRILNCHRLSAVVVTKLHNMKYHTVSTALKGNALHGLSMRLQGASSAYEMVLLTLATTYW